MQTSPRGPLSTAIVYDHMASGNTSYGWMAGGVRDSSGSGKTIVDRIDFSNDTPTAAVRGPLSTGSRGRAGVGNQSYGWIGTGNSSSGVDRIDYASDTSTATPKGPLTANRYKDYFGHRKWLSYGWFGGGSLSGSKSSVARVDYSNDAVTASTRGPLSSERRYLGATGNLSYGYFGGGEGPGGATDQNTVIDRIDFSNDTATLSVRGPLNQQRTEHAGTSGSRPMPNPQ